MGIGEEIISGALGRTNYNIFSLSERMSLELDSIYKDMAFLESEFAQRPGVFRFLAGQNFSLEDIKILRSKILLAKKISQELPELMGGNSGKTYLILIQNNMELRPTGGFIGSFGIANFESGKLTSIDIQDVYSADGQLKGYVEPPGVIKKYLNEANWFLRDSNWDPDFPTSAQVAEWFLDKEIAAKVDGVVAIDMGVALKLVELFGEINISDYGTVVNAANLYETTQSQVEEDFFPGSRKKANFLTALSNVLLEKLTNIEPSQVATLGQKLLESMDEKHLQIFFHNTQVQKAISELTWDGAVYTPGCSGNCYADSVGIVEANVGVNKVNYFIQRSAELTTTIGEESVGRTLSINIKNTAPVSLEKKGVYKNYLRVLAPLNSEFGDVLFASELEVTSLKPEVENIRGRSEAGVYVEIPAGEVRSIVFNWTSAHTLNFSEKGEYRMVWRKQAGTGEDAVSVKISTPLAKANAYPEANLTVDGSYTYNTYLARDFSSRIFW
ncbi:DUF4012 domain-containing protein [Patescibacteria group bacterium]|nr:DUF4012 domain-containing protein [Patescibacteria group bacterium]